MPPSPRDVDRAPPSHTAATTTRGSKEMNVDFCANLNHNRGSSDASGKEYLLVTETSYTNDKGEYHRVFGQGQIMRQPTVYMRMKCKDSRTTSARLHFMASRWRLAKMRFLWSSQQFGAQMYLGSSLCGDCLASPASLQNGAGRPGRQGG